MKNEHQSTDNDHAIQYSESTDEINLLDILLVLAKRWKMIVGVPFVLAIITALYTLIIPNSYTSRAMIIPTGDSSGGLSAALSAQFGGLVGMAGGLGGKTTGELYVTMLNSATLRDPIIDKYELLKRLKVKYRVDAYKRLNAMTSVNLGKKDGVISVSVTDKDPKFAAELANQYITELGRLASGLSMTQAGANSAFYEQRIAATKVDLEKAADALKQFQVKNKIVSPSTQAQATISAIARLKGQLAVQEVQLAALQRQFTDDSQEVKNTKASVTNLRNQIARLEGQNGGSAIPSIGSVPELGKEYFSLMRDFKIQEAILEMLTKQYELANVNQTKDVAPFQILERASIPERKSKPKRSRIVITVAFASGIAMVLLAFLQHMSERMTPEDRDRWEQIKQLLPGVPKFSVFRSSRTNIQ